MYFTSHNVLKCLLNNYLVTATDWYTLHLFVIHSLTLSGTSAIVGLDLNNLEDSGGGPAFVVGYFPKHDKLSLLQVKPSCISDLRLFWDAATFFLLSRCESEQANSTTTYDNSSLHTFGPCLHGMFIIPNLKNCCWHPRFCFICWFLHGVLCLSEKYMCSKLGIEALWEHHNELYMSWYREWRMTCNGNAKE